MNHEQPKPDSRKANEPHADDSAPPPLAGLETKAPENPGAGKPKNDKDKTSEQSETIRQVIQITQPEPGSRIRRVGLWIKHDTKSTDWLIVIFTAVITITGLLQWDQIRSGAEHTRTLAEAAKRQADKAETISAHAEKIAASMEASITRGKEAMEASAKQSRAALDAAIAANQLDQRALVSVYVSSGVPEVGKVFPITTHMRNTGKTFAVNVRQCSLGDYTTTPHSSPLEPPRLRACAERDWTAPNLIPPNEEWAHDSFVINPAKQAAGLTADAVESLKDGGTILWQYGQIKYDDIFGKAHWTKFCYYRIARNGRAVWVTCNTGNDIDRNY